MAATSRNLNTDAAFYRMPIELWLLVFDFFTRPEREIHSFDQTYDYLRTAIRKLHSLQLVYRLWTQLLRPFEDHHAAFQALSCTTSNPPNAGRYSNLIRVPEHLYVTSAPRDSCIRTLSIHPTPNQPRSNEFTLSVRCLAPLLTQLTHFVCRIILSPASFDILSSSSCDTLTHLLVTFDDRVAEALPFFDRLANIVDLSLAICTSRERISLPSHIPALPSLTRVDLRGPSAGICFAAKWLEGTQESSIRALKLSTDSCMCCVLLVPFFACHGQNIRTLVLGRGTFRDLRYPLSRATALERIELWGERKEREETMRWDLPKWEGVVVEEDVERGWTSLKMDKQTRSP